MDSNRLKFTQMDPNGFKWIQMDSNHSNGSKFNHHKMQPADGHLS